MEANIKLSFPQLLELVNKLPGEQKIRLSKELEKETIQSKLTELLTSFRTDDLTMNQITEEVEKVRQKRYDQRTSH
ncbi:MAG: type II toxin-antitoxin system VapB15 family antitoxin [Bacteroidota bacterium]